LINRVKALLEPKLLPGTQPTADRMASPSALSSLFAPAPPAHPRPAYLAHPPREVRPAAPPWPNALTDAFTPPPPAPSGPSATPGYSPGSNASGQSAVARPPAFSADVQKLRLEIARLDLLVKKLQTELQIERQYNQALESQIRAITESV